MKILAIIFFTWWANLLGTGNAPIKNLDVNRFAGKWYSLYSTPTKYDRGSRETTTTYTLTSENYYNVKTVYKKGASNEAHVYNSKLFLNENKKYGALEAQFIWPFKADYWVIEVGDDYEYAVVGHPDFDYLFILSRNKSLDKQTYNAIVSRCKAKGYPVDKLTSQQF